MKIEHNVQQLTDAEKSVLSKAIHFEYVYGNGLIFFQTTVNMYNSWDCTDSVAAKQYLEEHGIKEVNKPSAKNI